MPRPTCIFFICFLLSSSPSFLTKAIINNLTHPDQQPDPKAVVQHVQSSFNASITGRQMSRVSFNDNEALQSPEERPDDQHSSVVVDGSNIEGNNSVRVDIGGDESGKGAVGGGERRDGGRIEGGAGRGVVVGGEDRGDVESGGEDRNCRSNISKLAKMFIMVTVQTTAACMGFQCSDQHPHHFLNKIFLDSIVVDDLVGFLCCMIAIFLIYRKPHIAEILGAIGFIVVVFGFILLTTLFFVKSHVCRQ